MTFRLDVGVRKRTLQSLALEPRSTVLDLACGTGDFVKALEAQVHTAIGIDLSYGMMAAASLPCDSLMLPIMVLGGCTALLLVGALVAVLVGLPALRLRGLYLAVTTLAVSLAAGSAAETSVWLSCGSLRCLRSWYGGGGDGDLRSLPGGLATRTGWRPHSV